MESRVYESERGYLCAVYDCREKQILARAKTENWGGYISEIIKQ